MSCFRCGKELPEFQTECDPPCDERTADSADVRRCLCIEVPIDRAAVERDDPALRAAMAKFGALLGDAIVESGLWKFVTRTK